MKKWNSAIAIALLAISSNVSANDNIPGNMEGWNLAIGISYDELKLSPLKEYGVALYLGAGYRFNQYVAVEARLGTSVSDYQWTSGEYALDVESSSFYSGYFKLMHPLVSGLTPYALLGGYRGNYDATLSDSVSSISASDHDTGFSWGLGLEYPLNAKGVGVTLGLEYISYLDNDYISSDGVGFRVGYQF
jgi:opacity protein-like surface antigen